MGLAKILHPMVLGLVAFGVHSTMAGDEQESAFSEPTSTREMLDFLGTLSESGTKAEVLTRVEAKIKAYLDTNGIPQESVQWNLESVIDKVAGLRKILLKDPGQYGQYSELTDSDIDASADVLFDWVVKDDCGLRVQSDPLEEDSQTEFPVCLKVYDMSYGRVKSISKTILGYQLDGVWHTGLAAYGQEYIYGDGVCSYSEQRCEEVTPAQFVKRIPLGNTCIPQAQFETYLDTIADVYSECKYDFFDWNCHNFSNCASLYLTDDGIPEEYLNIASDLRRSVGGRIIIGLLRTQRCIALAKKKICYQIPRKYTPSTLKEALNFLGKLIESNLKTVIIKKVAKRIDQEVKEYISLNGIPGETIEKNLEVFLDTIPEVRKKILGNACKNSYDLYSHFRPSENSLGKYAKTVAKLIPFIYSELWFRYFTSPDTECRRLCLLAIGSNAPLKVPCHSDPDDSVESAESLPEDKTPESTVDDDLGMPEDKTPESTVDNDLGMAFEYVKLNYFKDPEGNLRA